MKSCTAADPVNLMEASTMTCGWICLWTSKLVFALLLMGLVVGLSADASMGVILLLLRFGGGVLFLSIISGIIYRTPLHHIHQVRVD